MPGVASLTYRFQVMPPRGGICNNRRFHIGNHVSSHAPARGHHRCVWLFFGSSYSFKSCPREGASQKAMNNFDIEKFQVMPPRGGITSWAVSPSPSTMFQVMPPRGGITIIAMQEHTAKFQVMPPRGGIFSHADFMLTVKVSSHAPARGHRCPTPSPACGPWFQVMPPRGGIPSRCGCVGAAQKFQVMPPRGGILLREPVGSAGLVSSHAPARGHQFIELLED